MEVRAMRVLPLFARLAPAFAGILAGCGPSATPSAVAPFAARAFSPALSQAAESAKIPVLIAFDVQTGRLEDWAVRRGGSEHPRPRSAALGIYDGYAMAAHGTVVAIANYAPPEILTYNVDTKAKAMRADPYGNPIDIAIDKKATLYALNAAGSVAVYAATSSRPTELTCHYVNDGVGVAVDNESDVFVDGYGPRGFMGVVEFAAGSLKCERLDLRPELGYLGGVGIDPKTDDLIVVDDPDYCAGGQEGRMLVYGKPYRARSARTYNLGAIYCAGTFRLNAASTLVFVSDATVSAGFALVDQRAYPSGARLGEYGNGASGGFTTIPNRLPN
jgi:hypothetical protein